MKLFINNVISIIAVGGKDNIIVPDLFKNIREYFAIKVEGAFFSRAFKKHQWDGYHYFVTPTGKILTGLIPMLLRYMESEYPEIDIEISDDRGTIPVITEYDWTKIGEYEVRNEQKDILKAINNYISYRNQLIYWPRGVIDAATNTGKTLVMAGIFLNTEVGGKKNMLILIHRKPIFKQMTLMLGKMLPLIKIGQISQDNYKLGDITIGMIKSTYNRMMESNAVKKDLSEFNILIVDESHRAGSKTYRKVLLQVQAPIRIFMSGTALDSNNLISKVDIIGLAGERLINVTKRQLMDAKVSKNVKVMMHLCSTYNKHGLLEYDQYQDNCIKYSIERAEIIKRIINENFDKHTIIVVEEIKHGQFLYDYLGGDNNGDVEFTHGQDSLQSAKLQEFKDDCFSTLISTAVLQEGVNIPIANNMIYCVGKHSMIKVKQWMGRVERWNDVDDEAVFHDFYDIGRFIEKDSKLRMKIYKHENLEVICNFDKNMIKNL